jgi:CTP synthase (UTP-ammonia lyase)
VGDIESLPFVEAVRQLQWEMEEEDCLVVTFNFNTLPEKLLKN